MFTIIGADQKQYGPVSADEIRQWIRDGRADGRTLARQEGTTEWKSLATFPEFATALAGAPTPTPPPLSAPTPAATPEEILSQDYELDIFSCISRAWNLASANIGPVVGYSLLVAVAESAVGQVTGMISAPSMKSFDLGTNPSFQTLFQNFMTPTHIALGVLSSLLAAPFQTTLLGGLYNYYIMLIRGQKPELADAFAGFKHFSQLAILGLVMNVLMIIGFFLCVIPCIYLSVALMFSIPLVMDKKLGWQEAMKLSMKMVNKHWFMAFGLILVAALVGVSGVLVCCVGLLFTGPVSLIALMYAYEDIFGRKAR
jgi:uncharacterized membrane protein